MFELKQCIKFLILPPGCWLLLLLAVLIFWKRRWARKLLLVMLIAIYLFHSDLIAGGLAWLLESRYKPLLNPQSVGAYDAIVTLTAGMIPPGGLIPYPRLNEAQFHRLEETWRLYRLNPKPVIVSGRDISPERESRSENRMICDYLIGMGVRREDVISEGESRDTFENAVEVKKILDRKGWRRYLLVTSAAHMPRSMLVFSQIAPEPLPAPGDFTVGNKRRGILRMLGPSEDAAEAFYVAIHEYIGLVNYRLRLLYDRH